MGVGVMQTKNEVLLEQSAYTKALLSRFGMDKANFVATPVDVNADLIKTSDEVEDCDKDLYQSAVERLRAGSKPGNEYELFLVSRRELALIGKPSTPHPWTHPRIVAWSSPSSLL
ncbi:hypothetical protein FHG87_022390 [Trinorchestia longiramus]|nr:hypothetical protein FHG87_022390 [Trinorchestia longiramus]